MTIQHRYALSAWSPSQAPIAGSSAEWGSVIEGSVASMKASLAQAYEAEGCSLMRKYWFEHTECWQGDPAVDDAIGVALGLAQQITSDFLYGLPLP